MKRQTARGSLIGSAGRNASVQQVCDDFLRDLPGIQLPVEEPWASNVYWMYGLVLDEATSHLDVNAERLVSSAVMRLPLTRIIVAHRPETIASADRVIELPAPSRARPAVAQQAEALKPSQAVSR